LGTNGPLGVEVELRDELPPTALLYGEGQSRVVISCDPSRTDSLRAHFEKAGVPSQRIGRVGAPDGRFRIETRTTAIDVSVADLARTYYDAIPRRMDRTPIDVATSLDSEVHRP
jgi:phosphoribosylformylglycinamidine (FGAM) synthase-like enzyme